MENLKNKLILEKGLLDNNSITFDGVNMITYGFQLKKIFNKGKNELDKYFFL